MTTRARLGVYSSIMGNLKRKTHANKTSHLLTRARCVSLAALALVSTALSQDTNCPAYPSAARITAGRALDLDHQFARRGRTSRLHVAAVVPPSKNVIDEWIFKKMTDDGVDAAPLTTDAEFVRRLYLDLTGRIPTMEEAQGFLSDSSATKRDKLIDTLLASPAFVDQFSHWFLTRFQVTRFTGLIGIPERNNFYNFVRQFVEQDRPYDAFVRDMITAAGDTDITPSTALMSRQVTDPFTSAKQDFWDDFTDVTTTQFLGFKTSCVSCHNGRGHLEKINLFLAPLRRVQFWRLSAFFSRTKVQVVSDDIAGSRRRLIFTDEKSGQYTGIVNPGAPGPRPSRGDANELPQYLLTGEQPASGAWRSELARIVTNDPLFARASVNYIWAYLFGSGIVDPPDGWDLARVDPANPPPPDWQLQVSHPELLAELANRYKASQYSLRAAVKLMVSSNAYQLSSRYPAGKWQSAYARYFARHDARRLTAEQLFDSLTTATGTEALMQADGMPAYFRYANQLPHPRSSLDSQVDSLLTSLGQGDWVTQPPSNQPSLYGILDFFNSASVSQRTTAWSDANSPQTRLAVWVGSNLSDNDIIKNLVLATLTRTPTAAETAAILARKQPDRKMWLTALQWALLQKSDFVFNY